MNYHIRILSAAQRQALVNRWSETKPTDIPRTHYGASTIATIPVGSPVVGYVRENEAGHNQVFDEGPGTEVDFQGGGIYLVGKTPDLNQVEEPNSELGYLLGDYGYDTIPNSFAAYVTRVTYLTGETDENGNPDTEVMSLAEADAQGVSEEDRLIVRRKPVLLSGMSG